VEIWKFKFPGAACAIGYGRGPPQPKRIAAPSINEIASLMTYLPLHAVHGAAIARGSAGGQAESPFEATLSCPVTISPSAEDHVAWVGSLNEADRRRTRAWLCGIAPDVAERIRRPA
jgi:hypothetical protein